MTGHTLKRADANALNFRELIAIKPNANVCLISVS